MAEWSKALRSGRSLSRGAWVRIPLLTNFSRCLISVVSFNFLYTFKPHQQHQWSDLTNDLIPLNLIISLKTDSLSRRFRVVFEFPRGARSERIERSTRSLQRNCVGATECVLCLSKTKFSWPKGAIKFNCNHFLAAPQAFHTDSHLHCQSILVDIQSLNYERTQNGGAH